MFTPVGLALVLKFAASLRNQRIATPARDTRRATSADVCNGLKKLTDERQAQGHPRKSPGQVNVFQSASKGLDSLRIDCAIPPLVSHSFEITRRVFLPV